MTLVNTIAMSKTPVYTINLRDALSAAGYVFMSGHRRKTLDDLIVRRTKIDAKTLRAKSSREWFIGVDDMIKHGVADQIVTSLEEIL